MAWLERLKSMEGGGGGGMKDFERTRAEISGDVFSLVTGEVANMVPAKRVYDVCGRKFAENCKIKI
jgi:hypothetical protein